MIDDIITFYQNKLTTNGLLKEKFKWKYNLLNFFVFVSFFLCFLVIISIDISTKIICIRDICLTLDNLIILSYSVLIILVLIIFFTIRRFMLSKLLKKDLKIKRKQLQNYFLKELEKFMRKNKYSFIEDEIIKELEDRAKQIKVAFLFKQGMISGLGLILFSSFCNKFYSLIGGDLNYFILITFFLIIIILTIVAVGVTYKDSYETFLSKYTIINDLLLKLRDNKLSRKIKEK